MGISTVLRAKNVAKSLLYGLYNDHRTVKVGFFIDLLKHPIGKASEKSALTELYYFFIIAHIRSSLSGIYPLYKPILNQFNTLFLDIFDEIRILS
jgi:hypothetical protein